MKRSKMDIKKEAFEKARRVLEKCSTVNGLYASGGEKGYQGVWARDSMISLIGASVIPDKNIKEQFEKSLVTLAEYQSEKGQIPNAILELEKVKPQVDYLSIDSSLWFIIGHYVYKKRYNDKLFKKYRKNINKTFEWLGYHDLGEDGMLEQLPTTDWQDAFPHRYGRTINTQALYYFVLNLFGKKKETEKLKFMVNENSGASLWQGDYYLAYRWKNHGAYMEKGEWFDSLGNLLAIIFEIADRKKAEKILSHIYKNKINEPYPIKAIYPPIRKESKYWQDYYLNCDAGKPYHYLNAGVWLYVGSFYVLALIKLGKFTEAEKELKKLAEANLKGDFPEWINPLTRTMHGELQAWNAGTYILAYESLMKKKCLL